MPHEILNGCGHFCQEDRPAELSQGVIEMGKLAGILD
jgi:haloalkane dehalogenase